MQRINDEKLGRWNLRLDAAYCAMLWTGVALFASQIADVIMLPLPLIAAVGIAVVTGLAACCGCSPGSRSARHCVS